MLHRGFVFVGLLSLVLVACGGGAASPFVAPTATPSAPPSAPGTVTFLVVVPAAGPAARHRNIVVPSSATSVTFTIDSVSGTAYSGTPVNQTLSSSNSACQSIGGQLSCAFAVGAPAGAVVFTVTVYSGTTVLAEGNVAVTTTSGGSVTAPLTLTGTVSKIAVTVAQGVSGIKGSVPVTVQAEDAKGNTILGNYSSPITLSDTDSSGQTAIATTGSDNPPAGQLVSSSDTATLSYAGGAMQSAATIGASASGVSASNITPGSFLPVVNWKGVSGSVTELGVTYESSGGAYDATPTPGGPAPTSTTFPVAVATGQTFDGTNNLVGITGLPSQSAVNFSGELGTLIGFSGPVASLSNSATSYYAWTATAAGAALGLVGYADGANASYPVLTYLATENSLTQTCASPYPQQLILPLPGNWSPFAGSAACTTAYTDAGGDSDTYVASSNGSYSDTYNLFAGGWGPCPCVTGNSKLSVDGAGNVSYAITGNYGTGTVTVAAPSPNASTVPVTFAVPVAIASPIVATPAPSSAPNPWRAIGVTNGTPPSPLLQDTMTSKGAIASLPTACAVPSGLVSGSNPPLSEVDESIVVADPMDDYAPLYTTETIKHYYLNGVGEICSENQSLSYVFDGVLNGHYIGFTGTGGPPVWSFEPAPGGALAWYYGADVHWDSYSSDTYTYITQTTLTAVQARVHDFTKVLPAASQALTMATYSIAHSPSIRPQHRMRSERAHWSTGSP